MTIIRMPESVITPHLFKMILQSNQFINLIEESVTKLSNIIQLSDGKEVVIVIC